jgi:hypothetical protein
MPCSIPNPIAPDRFASAERLDEIGDLLAAGLQRLRARKSSGMCPDPGESSLHISPDQSGRVDPAIACKETT